MQEKEDVCIQKSLFFQLLTLISIYSFQLEKSLAAACSQADLTTQSLKQQLSEVKTQLSLEKSERGKELAKNQVTVR
jgi:hypothetical protein